MKKSYIWRGLAKGHDKRDITYSEQSSAPSSLWQCRHAGKKGGHWHWYWQTPRCHTRPAPGQSASAAEGSIRRRQSQLSSDRATEEFYKTNVSVGVTRPRSFCNSLIIRYHFRYSVETQAFFWSRFRAAFYNLLRISASENQTWLRPAWDFTGMIFIRILPNKIHALWNNKQNE